MVSDADAAGRLEEARALMSPCRLCPRECGVDRAAGERGFCLAGAEATVASVGPHFGEEPCLVGKGGSGTIFLAGCNLGCVFCQNLDISHALSGRTMDAAALAEAMLGLEGRGCENVNLVTPTHVAPALAEAIVEARRRGLKVPVVWNSSGYESVEMLRLAEGLVEIYMPDLKFSRTESAERYCGAPDYPERARAALGEMRRQVGDLALEDGVARRGLLVRHLVMPGGGEETREVLDFLATLSPRTCVNVMGQYRPAGRLSDPEPRREFEEIARAPTVEEIAAARGYARELGLRPAQ